MIWIGIGVAVVGWFIGLLLELGPWVHALLVVALALLVIEVRRRQPA